MLEGDDDREKLRTAVARATQLCERLEANEADIEEIFRKVTDWVKRFDKAYQEGVELKEEMSRFMRDNKRMRDDFESIRNSLRDRLDGNDADWWKQGGNED